MLLRLWCEKKRDLLLVPSVCAEPGVWMVEGDDEGSRARRDARNDRAGLIDRGGEMDGVVLPEACLSLSPFEWRRLVNSASGEGI